ncbi:hypothetical protein BSKO_09487 [Bryopsis sp. KO-2023]|nr:hypothetical protein BSKO_09487 [Bryopsis sp. KO-2023]
MGLFVPSLSKYVFRSVRQGVARSFAFDTAQSMKVSVASKLDLSDGEIQQFSKKLGQFTPNAEPLLRGEALKSEIAVKSIETLQGLGFNPRELRRVLFKNSPIMLQDKERIERGWNLLKTELDMTSEQLRSFLMRDSWGLIRLNQAAFQVRLEYFVNLGFKRKQFISMITRHPHLLAYNFGKMVGPRFNRYLEEGMTKEEVVQMFDKDPSMFGKSFANSVLPKIKFLVEVGVARETIFHDWLVNHPGCIRNALGSYRDKYNRIMQKGFSALQFLALMRDGGRLLNRDINQTVEKIDFIRDVLKKTNKDIAEYPECLGVAFHGKMTRRVAYLDCKGRDYQALSLLDLLGPPDDVFARERAGGSKADLKDFGAWWDELPNEKKLDKLGESSYPNQFYASNTAGS